MGAKVQSDGPLVPSLEPVVAHDVRRIAGKIDDRSVRLSLGFCVDIVLLLHVFQRLLVNPCVFPGHACQPCDDPGDDAERGRDGRQDACEHYGLTALAAARSFMTMA